MVYGSPIPDTGLNRYIEDSWYSTNKDIPSMVKIRDEIKKQYYLDGHSRKRSKELKRGIRFCNALMNVLDI